MVAQIAKLASLRALAVVLNLVQSVLIIRFLTLNEIGWYYLITTIAYLGNATIFVGADFYLQRQLSRISINQPLYRLPLTRFILITSIMGGAITIGAAIVYFSIAASNTPIELSIVCALLSICTYLSALGRNLCQLASLPVYSNIGLIIEGIFRAISLSILAFAGRMEPSSAVIIGALSSLLSFAITFRLLLSKIPQPPTPAKPSHPEISYINCKMDLGGIVLSIGVGGFLNWVQLQGYRPLYTHSFNEDIASIGAVSFLSTLGSSVAGSAFSILAQIRVPTQYQTTGSSTPYYIWTIAKLSLILSIISLPVASLYLWITEKWYLHNLVYLVVVGVLIEAGNAVIGSCAHHKNAQKKRMWPSTLAGIIGCAATFAILLFPIFNDINFTIASALITGQLLSVFITLYLTFSTIPKR